MDHQNRFWLLFPLSFWDSLGVESPGTGVSGPTEIMSLDESWGEYEFTWIVFFELCQLSLQSKDDWQDISIPSSSCSSLTQSLFKMSLRSMDVDVDVPTGITRGTKRIQRSGLNGWEHWQTGSRRCVLSQISVFVMGTEDCKTCTKDDTGYVYPTK